MNIDKFFSNREFRFIKAKISKRTRIFLGGSLLPLWFFTTGFLNFGCKSHHPGLKFKPWVQLSGKHEKSQLCLINLLKPYYKRVEHINILINEKLNLEILDADIEIFYLSASLEIFDFAELSSLTQTEHFPLPTLKQEWREWQMPSISFYWI